MSRRIFLDIEEAIAREVRRITFNDARTVDKVVFKEVYDPFTGEIVSKPIEPSFYDSSADASAVEYPHFFIRLMKTKEDLTTGRVIPQYGKYCITPEIYSPKAFEIITRATDGIINTVGSTITTGTLKISVIQPGQLLRLLNGNNKGTYTISSVTKDTLGNHSITVSNTLISTLPIFAFDSTTRTVSFTDPVDLNTIKIGDTFTDSASNTYNITSVSASTGTFVIDGTTTPNTAIGSSVARVGDVFTQVDTSTVTFLIMDPTKPVKAQGIDNASSVNVLTNPEVPLDAYYLVRIDSKNKDNHTMILNRIWEEFNPPRTALPTIRRTSLSAEGLITEDVLSGGSDTVKVSLEDAQEFSIGDKVFIFNDLTPSKRLDGEGFERPFEATIIDKPSANELKFDVVVPDTFTVADSTKIVSNAEFQLYMFHFVDHVTKDVEGSQYWVHEFTFWTQIWVDRQGDSTGTKVNTITQPGFSLEDNDDGVNTTTNYIYDENY